MTKKTVSQKKAKKPAAKSARGGSGKAGKLSSRTIAKHNKIATVRKAGRPGKQVATVDDSNARAYIVAIATDLFGDKGFEGVSTREIAQKSGLNISLISYYFGGKLGLYKEVLRSHIVGFMTNISPSVKSSSENLTAETLRLSLKTILDRIFDMAESNRSIMNIMAREKLEGMPHAQSVHEEVIGPFSIQLTGLIKEAQKKGIVRSGVNAHSFFSFFFEGVFGYIGACKCDMKFREEALNTTTQAPQLKEFILDLFFKGILK